MQRPTRSTYRMCSRRMRRGPSAVATNGTASPLVLFFHHLVQHLEQFRLFHRLEQIEEGLDIVTVGGEVIGTGEVDDVTAVSQSPQAASCVDSAQPRHEDVQHIEVKAPRALRPCQQGAAAQEGIHLPFQVGPGLEVGMQQQ